MATTQIRPSFFECPQPLCDFTSRRGILGSPYLVTQRSIKDIALMIQGLVDERDGTKTFWNPVLEFNMKEQPIATLAKGIRLAYNPSEVYRELSRHLLAHIALISGVPTLFEEDPTPLAAEQATKLVEVLKSVQQELPDEPLVTLSVLRAQERGGYQFAGFRDFAKTSLDKYHLEYAFRHCDKCSYHASHNCVFIWEGPRLIGLFCEDCLSPGNPNDDTLRWRREGNVWTPKE
nr:hypothetical protein LTR18_010856 [Exophiala xenobiotica]